MRIFVPLKIRCKALVAVATAAVLLSAAAAAERVRYRCSDGKGIIAIFLDGAPARLRLERDNEIHLLDRMGVEKAASYAGSDVSFKTVGNRASVTWKGLEIQCIEWR